jgi:hypothetical protein
LAFAVKNGTTNSSLIPALQKFHLVYSIGIQPSEVDKMSASEVVEFMKMAETVVKGKGMSRKESKELSKIL